MSFSISLSYKKVVEFYKTFVSELQKGNGLKLWVGSSIKLLKQSLSLVNPPFTYQLNT